MWPIGDAIDGITVTIDARQQVGGGNSIRTENDMQPKRARAAAVSEADAADDHSCGGFDLVDSQGFDLEFEAGLR
ncbi:hypothetical protein AB5I41_31475 [Sphingomonas sp. MMS24-JH45]